MSAASVQRFARLDLGGGRRAFARLEGGRAVVLDGAPWLPGTAPTGEVVEGVDDEAKALTARRLAPVTPSKILCVGRNYRAHAGELGNDVPAEPLLFFKPPSSLLDPDGTIELPPTLISGRVDHEAELGVVIGRRARRVGVEDAAACVFGCTAVCDVTARDLQKKDGQWTRAKGMDTFCPVGPVVVTGLDPQALRVVCRVNGDVRQDGSTRDMIFTVAAVIAYASRVMTLEPGDLLVTGTPSGVAPLHDGDRLEIEVPGIGTLAARVAADRSGDMSPRLRVAVAAVAVGAALALVAGVVTLARSRAEPPARCAPGMVALGARCCGEGQHLEGERCAGSPARCAGGMDVTPSGCVAPPRRVRIEGGRLRIGPGDWEAQGVVEPYEVDVAPFEIDVLEVGEARWAACSAAGACPVVALSGEPGRPVTGVTRDEAERFCRWEGGALPTAAELAFAAAGRAGRRYPWGDTGAVCRRAAWGLVSGPCGWGASGPELSGSHPDGASPEGVLDLAGNVAEWANAADGSAEVRGGSYADGAANALRAWQRRVILPGTRSREIGFRCARR